MIVDRQVLILFLLFVSLNAADVITTLIGLQIGAVEGDPETLLLMNKLGVIEALLLKFFVVLFLGLVVLVSYHYSVVSGSTWSGATRIFILMGFAFGCSYYVFVVFRNVRVIANLLS